MSPGLTSLLQDYRIKWSGKELLNKRAGYPGDELYCELLLSFPCRLTSFEVSHQKQQMCTVDRFLYNFSACYQNCVLRITKSVFLRYVFTQFFFLLN